MVPRFGDLRLERFRAMPCGRKLAAAKPGEAPRQMNASASKPRLGRDIAIVLAAKLVLLTILYLAFFAPADRPQSDSAAVTAKLLDLSRK
jgi:hypothetical protein